MLTFHIILKKMLERETLSILKSVKVIGLGKTGFQKTNLKELFHKF